MNHQTNQYSVRRLIYPERRFITDAQIVAWGFDVKVDEAVREHQKTHAGALDDDAAYDRFVATIDHPTVEEAIALLEDLGLATFQAAR